MSHIIIGTAGHIDHGKSSLVKRLTGTDPDRLSEEQERGMTIDLGFAFLTDNIAFIDVPGHEKFIKNMVAGVSTVDMAMLVVAADDGVMPQTREHLDILSLLQVREGVIALTKIDLVEPDWIALVEEDIRSLVKGTFLEKAPIFRVSSATGAGVDALREALIQMADRAHGRKDRGVFWMPVDRSFTIKGFGTVVTGSVLSGQVAVGESVELLPAQRVVKIRGIQTHGKAVEAARLGDRAALNLANISKDEIERGDVLATPEYFEPSRIFDVRFHLLRSAQRPLKHRTRVRLHVGTREIMARIRPLDAEVIEPGQSAFVQLFLEEPAVAIRRDPFVIRQYSPPITIGGGTILDTNPVRHKRFDAGVLERLAALEEHDPTEVVVSALLARPIQTDLKELIRASGISEAELIKILDGLVQQGLVIRWGPANNPFFFHSLQMDRLKERLLNALEEFHRKEPLRPGMSKAELRNQLGEGLAAVLFERALEGLKVEGKLDESQQWVKLKAHQIRLSENERELADVLTKELLSRRFATPSEEELSRTASAPVQEVRRVLGALQGLGDVVRIEGNIYFHHEAVEEAREKLIRFGRQNEEISVSQFREMLGTSRKYAMALLTYFDQIGLTERVGEVRLVHPPE